jgi:tripartite-type tricarboxylate transporter receptor subunit TctC
MNTLKKLTTILFPVLLSLTNAYAFDPTANPIKVVIPFAPGGGVDQTFRHFEKYAAKKGLTFIPIYKPGAEGLIGMNEIAGMPKDGYHVSFGTVGTIAVQRVRNSAAELDPITAIRNSVTSYVSSKNSGINSIQDLYKATVTVGYGAPGQKMLLEKFSEMSKKKPNFIWVPYKGGALLVQDLAGGHVQFGAPPLIISKALIDSGKIKLLAVGSSQRLKEYPDVPTTNSIFPGWEDVDAFTFILPKNTDPAAEKYWSQFLKDYMSNTDVQADFIKEFNELNEFGRKPVEKLIKNAVTALSKP